MPSLGRLLFVGCDWYTREYVELFAPRRERYRTVDIDPAKARFGAPGHVIAPMQEIDRHFAPGSIDVIVANGVYGFGIDDRAGLGAAFAAARAVLAAGRHAGARLERRPGAGALRSGRRWPARPGSSATERQSARRLAHDDRHAAAPHLRRLRAQRREPLEP